MGKEEPKPNYPITPLLCEPGEGRSYGASIYWSGVVVSTLAKQPLGEFIQENIFNPLGMTSSTYQPQERPDISSKLLQMVRRDLDRLLPAEVDMRQLICSVPNVTSLLADLISPSSRLLKESIDLLFAPQFAPSSAALSALRNDTEAYAAPAGKRRREWLYIYYHRYVPYYCHSLPFHYPDLPLHTY